MRDAQEEEFNHFSTDLEFRFRRSPLWRGIARRALSARAGRAACGDGRGGGHSRRVGEETPAEAVAAESLGIGSLKGSSL